jgi:hypothetical protein
VRTPSLNSKGDPLDYVVSKNLRRRHLNEGQRAMVTSKIATMKHGGDRGNQHTVGKVPIGTLADIPLKQAAKMMNVSVRSVKRARVVRTRGVHALQKAVEDGAISIYAAAAIATQPREEQVRIARFRDYVTGQRPAEGAAPAGVDPRPRRTS